MKKTIPLNVFIGLAAILAAACNGSDNATDPNNNVSNNLSTIQAGEVRVLSASDVANGMTLPATTGASEFIIMVENANETPDVNSTYTFKAAFNQGVSPNALSFSKLVDSDQKSLQALVPQTVFEDRLRGLERTGLDMHVVQNMVRNNELKKSYGISAVQNVGNSVTIKVPDGNSGSLCNTYTSKATTVKYVGTHAVILEDNSRPNMFSQAQYDSIGSEFDNLIYSTDVQYFGNPSDVNNDSHIYILYTPEVNKLTPPGTAGSQGFVGGFFWAGDLFPTSSCAQSNIAEIFYLLAPDPTGINGNVFSAASVRQGTRGTIAHEFQHMINTGRRLFSSLNANPEDTWLDEALAHFAEDAVGRASRGYTISQKLSGSDVGANTNDFNAFFFQNQARYGRYLRAPGDSGAISSDADQSLAVRGAAWSFVRYIADHYAPNGVPTLIKNIVGGPQTGITNIENKTGVTFQTIMQGWAAANYDAPGAGFTVSDARFTYLSYNMRSTQTFVSGGYPLTVNQISGTNYTLNTQVQSGGANYFRLVSSTAQPARTLNLFAASTGTTPASFTGLRVTVYRAQ